MTGYVDHMFPVSPPSFLFSHDIVIVHTSQLANDTDDNGWPIEHTATETPAKAYVASPDPRTLTPAGVAVDVVVLVPNGTVVSHADQVRVPTGQGLPPLCEGLFRVDTARPNPSHTRVLCLRVTDPDGAER